MLIRHNKFKMLGPYNAKLHPSGLFFPAESQQSSCPPCWPTMLWIDRSMAAMWWLWTSQRLLRNLSGYSREKTIPVCLAGSLSCKINQNAKPSTIFLPTCPLFLLYAIWLTNVCFFNLRICLTPARSREQKVLKESSTLDTGKGNQRQSRVVFCPVLLL